MHNHDSIIQWNARGINIKYDELRFIISQKTPIAVCIQETHLKPTDEFAFSGYKCFRKDRFQPNQARAQGGVMILVRENLTTNLLHVNSHLQAIAVEILTPIKINIINIYLPDNSWREEDLRDTLGQIPQPTLLTGDFNCHNRWWGSESTKNKGRKLEEIINNTPLILLNSGKPTYLNATSGTLSAIDLSFASPSIAVMAEWDTFEDPHHSDHFPISIKLGITKQKYSVPPRWNIKKADWTSFREALDRPIEGVAPDQLAANLTRAISEAAKTSIPETSPRGPRPAVPWWNQDIRDINKQKKKALNKHKKYPSMNNLIEFKKLRAREKKLKREAQQNSWEEYVSSINPSTHPAEMWKKVKSIIGKQPPPSLPIIEHQGAIHSDASVTANILGKYFEEVAEGQKYTFRFREMKRAEEQAQIDFSGGEQELYNNPFNMAELDHALENSRESAPGPDNITYSMIKNLTMEIKSKLLQLFNLIWSTGTYPQSWKEATIVALPKPNKDSRKV